MRRIIGLGLMLVATSAAAVSPHRSARYLPSSNGRAAIAFDSQTGRLTQFLEHPYRYPAAGQETRNFAFDSYPGARVGGAGSWLTDLTPSLIEYLPGTGIVHVTRTFAGVRFDEYHFTPMSLPEHASLMLVEATRQSGAAAPIDVYALFNYHLGSGGPTPGADAEQAAYIASRDAFYEWGPSNVAFGYGAIGASTHHAVTPQNPFAALGPSAAADLGDNAGTGGPVSDAVPGFQMSLGSPAVGAPVWTGWFTVLAPDAQAEPAVDRVRAWIAGRAPDRLLADEVAGWQAWRTPAPAGASADEAALWAQAQVVLRMGQVTEPGAGAGQILASVAPGKWNIAWVRDMAYATVALARSGHLAEARAAIEFQLGASVGGYQSYVGRPYRISVVRYFGNGSEEADSNADGPNIEFDGFGLFLWEVDEYLRAGGDASALTTWWPALRDGVAGVLTSLQETAGLIAADSSIWEVHWNGQQKHFTYTTLTAAHGLCAAARLAGLAGDSANQTVYAAAGARAQGALIQLLRAGDGTLAQSRESLTAAHWLDAAALEAINFGLIDPGAPTARATLHSILTGLTPPSGRGFMRNDDGGAYDSQEWVFVDLRAARAFALGGDSTTAAATLAWNVAQARANFDYFSELHDRVTADYAGESPMVGFGAGAFVLALVERGAPAAASCGAYAAEPGASDGGTGGDGGGSADGARADGGDGGHSGGGGSGCGCRATGQPAGAGPLWLLGAAGLIIGSVRARRKSRRPGGSSPSSPWPRRASRRATPRARS